MPSLSLVATEMRQIKRSKHLTQQLSQRLLTVRTTARLATVLPKQVHIGHRHASVQGFCHVGMF
jgi:hypothetical protein